MHAIEIEHVTKTYGPAVAVDARPPLLAQDEPFTELDPVNADLLREARLVGWRW